MKRKALAVFLALAMVLGVFVTRTAPVLAAEGKTTTGTFTADQLSETPAATTKVNVYKLKADGFDDTKVPAKHNLGLLSQADIQKLGTNVGFLKGVTFTYYKIEDEAQFKAMLASPGQYKTKAMVEAAIPALAGKGAETAATDVNGLASVELADGNYWFVESGFTPEADSTTSISKQIALPFGISLPYTNPTDITIGNETFPAGTRYLKTINIYPKNVVGDEPVIEKDVKEIGNKTATYKVGDVHPWIINATVPANISGYKVFKMTDTIDSRLDYVGNVVVAYGNFTKVEEVKNASADAKLVAGTDYKLTEPAVGAAGGKLEIELTAAGIAKLGEKYNAANKLFVTFETKINNTAVLGQPIPNDVDLTFDNGNGDEKHNHPDNPPTVITGGKRFLKLDKNDAQTVLPGAVFQVMDGDKAVTWTEELLAANKAKIDAGNFALDAKGKATSSTEAPKVGDPIYLLSAADGTFEIKGLALSYKYTVTYKKDAEGKVVRPLVIESVTEDKTQKEHDYKVKEVKAPAGYALPSGDAAITAFEVTTDSYYKEALKVVVGQESKATAADPLKIDNTKLTIPQTGGMGTILFTIVGLAIMGGALIAFKKNQKQADEA